MIFCGKLVAQDSYEKWLDIQDDERMIPRRQRFHYAYHPDCYTAAKGLAIGKFTIVTTDDDREPHYLIRVTQ